MCFCDTRTAAVAFAGFRTSERCFRRRVGSAAFPSRVSSVLISVRCVRVCVVCVVRAFQVCGVQSEVSVGAIVAVGRHSALKQCPAEVAAVAVQDSGGETYCIHACMHAGVFECCAHDSVRQCPLCTL